AALYGPPRAHVPEGLRDRGHGRPPARRVLADAHVPRSQQEGRRGGAGAMSYEVRAVHRNARMGAYKARRVLALIRGRSVNQALDELRHDRHRAARAIYKVLASAVANALQNPGVR